MRYRERYPNFLVPKLRLGNTLAWKLQLPVSTRVEARASTIKGVPKLELGNEKRRDKRGHKRNMEKLHMAFIDYTKFAASSVMVGMALRGKETAVCREESE